MSSNAVPLPLPAQRHPKSSNRVGEEGRVNEELSESPDQGVRGSGGLGVEPGDIGDETFSRHPRRSGFMCDTA
jgi:hypothetical protein